MDKIKVLVAVMDKAGVAYYRSTNPHILLQKIYPDRFHVIINDHVNWGDMDYLKKFDLVHFHRSMFQGNQDVTDKVVPELRKHGIKTLMDIDDHWVIPREHPMYNKQLADSFSKKITQNFKIVDFVTTTTEYYADKIRKNHNKNVYVIPNAVDPEENQFQPNKKTETEKVRVGWLGGSSHLEDLKLMYNLFVSLSKSGKKDVQLNLCGFDLRGTITDPKNGVTRKIKPEESIWYKYELLFTNNYELLKDNPEYINFLKNFEQKRFSDEETMPYRRHWTKNVKSYATNYNHIDVSLAPLVSNEFNKCKSQLKVIEAGFHKIPIICEKIEPYKIDIKDGVNGFFVDSTKKPKGWRQKLKKLVDNPSLREDIGMSLYETVKDKYDLKNVSKLRKEIYEEIYAK